MNKQQGYLLELLKEIHAICEKNNITYFLAGGTLIGSIRHGGFLPWDDDADLYMTRDNWEKFVEACKIYLPPNRMLQAPDIDLTYNNTFPRYVATDSTAIHSHQVLGGAAAGEVIDILILDPISDDDAVLEGYTYNLMLYADLLNYSAVFGRRFGIRARDYIKYSFMRALCGEKKMREHFEGKLAACMNEEGSCYVMRWGGNPLLFERSWFKEAKPAVFEDLMSYKPNGSSEYLIYHYGDEWSTVPPNVERASHDTASLPGVSSDEALQYYQPKVNPRKLHKRLSRRKALVLALAPKSYKLQADVLSLHAAACKMELDDKLARDREVFDKAVASDDYGYLARFFADYYAWQMSATAIGRDDWVGVYRYNHPILVNLSDELLVLAVRVLFFTERIGKAARLMQVIEQCGRNIPELFEYNQAILRFRDAVSQYQYGNYEETISVADDLLEKYSGNVSFLKLKIVALAALVGQSSGYLSDFEAALRFGEENFPEDGFFLKYRADVFDGKGKSDAAHSLYSAAVEKTFNGIVLLDIKKKTGLVPSWAQDYDSEVSDSIDIKQDAELEDAETAGGFAKDFADKASRDLVDPRMVLAKFPPAHDQQSAEQSYLFQLLCELTSLCDKHKIEYVISPRAAIAFFYQGVLPNGLSDYSIYLKAPAFKKLVDVLSSLELENRAFEYIGNNPSFPNNSIHFVGTDSVYINTKDACNYKHLGLFVSARLLSPERYSTLTGSLYTGWKKTCYRFNKLYSSKQFVSAFVVRVASLVMGRKRVGKRIFDKCLAEAGASKDYYRLKNRKKKILFPTVLFEESKQMSFKDVSFWVPADTNAYVGIALDKMASANTCPMQYAGDVVVSAQLSYKDFCKTAQFADDYFKRRRRMFWMNSYAMYVRKQFVKEFKRIKMAVSAKELILKYIEKKDSVLHLWAQGCYQDLLELFEPYIALLEKYEPLHKEVFDVEICRCIVDTLTQLDQAETIEKISCTDGNIFEVLNNLDK